MTLQEAGRRFHINIEKLNFYEENGLLECRQFVDGIPDYTEDELCRVGLIHSLMKAGFDLDLLKRYFSLCDHDIGDKQEKIRLLRKQRCRLLDEIHSKQQSLDELDYLIEKTKKEVTFSLKQ